LILHQEETLCFSSFLFWPPFVNPLALQTGVEVKTHSKIGFGTPKIISFDIKHSIVVSFWFHLLLRTLFYLRRGWGQNSQQIWIRHPQKILFDEKYFIVKKISTSFISYLILFTYCAPFFRGGGGSKVKTDSKFGSNVEKYS